VNAYAGEWQTGKTGKRCFGEITMNDQQLMRYGRHILLGEIGIEGQRRVLDSSALVIGVGGLGSPAALYLASSGVGRITVCDADTVELSNLQRQIMFRTSDIGRNKVDSARDAIIAINPDVSCVAIPARVDASHLDDLIAEADVVLDCSDNFATRYAVNRSCLAGHKPLVSGAAIQFHGQVSVFDFRSQAESGNRARACYNCLFPEDMQAAELRCATTGVFAPLVGMVGSMQAGEAIKLLAGVNQGLVSRLLTIDALDMTFMRSNLSRDPHCPVCGSGM
jgi:molybdopterin/thiamine biosynthesis adenylyltransferase